VCIELSCVVADVADWLLELGYDLNSLIPPVSYSGLVGRRHHDDDDDVSSGVAVTSAFRCAYDGNAARFTHLSIVTSSLVTCSDGLLPGSVRAGGGVASSAYVFGPGVLLTADADDTVTVTVLDSAAESLATLATTLLNGSTLVGPRLMTQHGRDVVHFVRRDKLVDDVIEDVRRVLQGERGAAGGLNVTIHRIHDSSSSVRYVDVRLHGPHATLNVRCGGTADTERARLRHRAHQRAVDAAWAAEKQSVRAGRLTSTAWTSTQAEQLLTHGRVDGFTGQYLRDDRLVDCPRNIRFVPVT